MDLEPVLAAKWFYLNKIKILTRIPHSYLADHHLVHCKLIGRCGEVNLCSS